MNKAIKMRKITDGVQNEKRGLRARQYARYVDKLIATKVHKAAINGNSRVEIKVKKSFAPTPVIEEFAKHGFDMSNSKSVNGRAVLVVKW